jgi:hypothetical protein
MDLDMIRSRSCMLSPSPSPSSGSSKRSDHQAVVHSARVHYPPGMAGPCTEVRYQNAAVAALLQQQAARVQRPQCWAAILAVCDPI